MNTYRLYFHQLPVYVSHEDAAAHGCVFCGGNLNASEAKGSGYAKGRGSQMSGRCDKCGCRTFYELAPEAIS